MDGVRGGGRTSAALTLLIGALACASDSGDAGATTGPPSNSTGSQSSETSAAPTTVADDTASAPLDACDREAPRSGDQVIEVEHGGQMRSYRLFVPESYQHGERTALVINFHGTGSTAAAQADVSQMREAAQDVGILVAFPQGLPLSGSGNVFNAGHRDFSEEPRDDVDFTRAVIDDVDKRACLARDRVYATGMSNGARMSHRLACEGADFIAAVGPVAGSLSLDPSACTPSRAISVMAFHGTQDGISPFEGTNLSTLNVEDTWALWADLNECPSDPVVSYQTTEVLCETYSGCAQGTEVTLCRIIEGGHCWPGNPLCVFGLSTVEIDASVALLSFFAGFSL
ncbi:MAG: hypothetical protein JKY37_29690 [Nannocystaceae bacterium]|nr:hypothetical protein [Nannocystaceae bacterium]